MLRLGPSLILAALCGCVRAAHPVEDSGIWRGRFEVAEPPGWEVTRNYRWMGNSAFTFTSPDGRDAITIELLREGRRSRELPLSLVSDALAMNLGRKMGIQPELLGQNEILVAGRQAWATTVIRRHGPNERLASFVALRGERHLVLLTLSTVPGGVPATALEWQLVIDTFALLGEAIPPDPPIRDWWYVPED